MYTEKKSKKQVPRLSYVTTLLPGMQRLGTRRVEGVLPCPTTTQPYTCCVYDVASLVPLRGVRAAYQWFLDQTEDIDGTNVYCQGHGDDALDSTPIVVRVVHETDEMYEARLNTAKMAKVNTLKERLAQHEAAAASIRAELEG